MLQIVISKMSGLKFYYDLMSQPCRAVYIFLKINKIPFVDKPVALRKGEHFSEEYSKINPLQKVPVIDDDGFILAESVAQLRYLCAKFPVASHWYPADVKSRARVDEYLAWQHWNTRMHGSAVFQLKINHSWYPQDFREQAKIDEFFAWHHTNIHVHVDGIYEQKVIIPRAMNKPVDKAKLNKSKTALDTTLDHIENYFLRDREYICGNEMTLADLLCICELQQPLAAGYNIYANRPMLNQWQERVKARLQPHFDEASKMVYKMQSVVKAESVDGDSKM